MRLAVVGFVVVAFLSLLAHAQDASDTAGLLHQLNASTLTERQAVLSHIVAQKSLLEDSIVQTALIQLQEKENALWIPEATDYADYYGQLITTVLQIAQTTINKRAYIALVNAVFNADCAAGQMPLVAEDPEPIRPLDREPRSPQGRSRGGRGDLPPGIGRQHSR
jgi:hypothetical protein